MSQRAVVLCFVLVIAGSSGAEDVLPRGAVVQCGPPLRMAQADSPLSETVNGDAVLALAFSPDGRALATGSFDNLVHVWDVATGREKLRLSGHRERVIALAFSPDGKLLASGSYDGTVRLWDIARGQPRLTLRGHRHEVAAIAFSPDGKLLAAVSRHDQTVQSWTVASGELLSFSGSRPGGIEAVAFSVDGHYLLAPTREGKMRTLVVEDGSEVRTFAATDPHTSSFAFSADGKTIVCLDYAAGTLRILDTSTGDARTVIDLFENVNWGLAISPDSQMLAVSSFDRRTVLLFDLSRPDAPPARLNIRHHANRLAFSPDGKLLATGGDRVTYLWDLKPYRKPVPQKRLTPTALRTCIEQLGGRSEKSFEAIWRLAGASGQAESAVDDWLRATALPDSLKMAQLIRDLDHRRYLVRQSAELTLESYGPTVLPHVRQTLRESPSLEQRRRAERLLERLTERKDGRPHRSELIVLRAVETLERLGTAQAREKLRSLAQETGSDLLRVEANAALHRLKRRE